MHGYTQQIPCRTAQRMSRENSAIERFGALIGRWSDLNRNIYPRVNILPYISIFVNMQFFPCARILWHVFIFVIILWYFRIQATFSGVCQQFSTPISHVLIFRASATTALDEKKNATLFMEKWIIRINCHGNDTEELIIIFTIWIIIWTLTFGLPHVILFWNCAILTNRILSIFKITISDVCRKHFI